MTTYEAHCQIRNYDDWRAPYIGRAPGDKFWDYFEKVLDKENNVIAGKHIFSTQTYEPNEYDVTTTTHSLTVYFSVAKEGIKPSTNGLITKIVGYIHTHFHTTSNWQDHAETKDSDFFVSDEKSINEYKKILNLCTITIGDDYVFNLFQHIKKVNAKYSDEPIYMLNNGWMFRSVTSHELVTILLYARSYLEFFFAIRFLAEMKVFAEVLHSDVLHSRSQLEYILRPSSPCMTLSPDKIPLPRAWQDTSFPQLETHLNTISEILGYISLSCFYEGYDEYNYPIIKQMALNRLMRQSGIARYIFDMPDPVVGCGIHAMMEVKLSKGKHDYRRAFIEEAKRDYWLDVSGLFPQDEDGCVDANSIPKDSWFFFSDVMNFLGYSTTDGFVYSNKRIAYTGCRQRDHELMGKMRDDGSIEDSTGKLICAIDDNVGVQCFNYSNLHKKRYCLWVDEMGHVLGGSDKREIKYLGEVYVWRPPISDGLSHDDDPWGDSTRYDIKLTKIQKLSNGTIDKRLAGIVLLGYLSKGDIEKMYGKYKQSNKRL